MLAPATLLTRCLSPVVAAAAAAALSGCSYQSTYVPPNDGRARLIWTGKEVAPLSPVTTPECLSRVNTLRQVPVSPWGMLEPDYDGWVAEPELNGNGSLVIGVRGRHAWAGHTRGWQGGHGFGGGHGVGKLGGSLGGVHLGGGHVGGGGGGHGGGGGGGGGDWGKGAIVLIVLAYAVIPTISIIWVADRPESTTVAAGVDAVHAYNDLVRAGDPVCGGVP